MNDWFNVLKVQILDTTTDLDINMEPMVGDEDDDCCRKTQEVFMNGYGRYWSKSGVDFTGEGENAFGDYFKHISCDDFKEALESYVSNDLMHNYPYWVEAHNFWEDCENE